MTQVSAVRERCIDFARHFRNRPALLTNARTVTWRELAEYGSIIRRSVPQGAFVVLPAAGGPDIATFLRIGGCLLEGIPFLVTRPKSYVELGKLIKKTFHHAIWLDADDVLKIESRCADAIISDTRPYLYVAQTSGTTGLPKLVPIRESDFEHFIIQAAELLDLDHTSVVADFGFLPSDLTLTNFLLCLSTGATWHVLDSLKDRVSPLSSVEARQATHLRCVASMSANLWRNYERNRVACTLLSHLVFGGENLGAAVAHDLARSLKTTRILNTYGASEFGGFVSLHQITGDGRDLSGGDTCAIGRPLAGYELVLAESVTADKEIVVKGNHLPAFSIVASAQGSEMSRNDMSIDGRTIIATGDLGHYSSVGLHVRGRRDRMVKIKGFRIQSEEVEKCLEGATGLTWVCVPRKDSIVLMCEGNVSVQRTDLLAILEPLFDSNLVSTRFIAVDALPRDDGGKLQVRAASRLAMEQLSDRNSL